VPALTSRGVRILDEWLDGNVTLKVSIIAVVYPTCAARQSDLDDLRAIVVRHADRLTVRILPLEQVTDRSINALCFSARGSDSVTIAVGLTENLGLDPWGLGGLNFAFQADPPLLEAFRCHFDWLWGNACDIHLPRATEIPELVLPKGSEEAAQTWLSYLNEVRGIQAHDDATNSVAEVAMELGNDAPSTSDSPVSQSPTEQLGIRALDPLAEFVAGLYTKGSLVSVDKLSKIPPLDAPLDPNLFGDASELRSGSVTRKVSMRVSVIDEKTLKAIETCRQALRMLLTKFTFGLADNMRWMPNTARNLFEAELTRVNDEGLKLISDLLKGDVDSFLSAKREKLVADLNGIYSQLGRPGHVTPDVVGKVVESLKARLTKAQSSDFMPKLTYSSISFSSAEGAFASPWGQAYSLLSDIAAFPRKAHTDSFFFRGLKTPRVDLLAAMDLASDVILRDSKSFELEERSKAELDLLATIENAPIESKARCKLVRQIIEGVPASSIERDLAEELKREPSCEKS
jgi:hypothetical protein